MVRAKTLSVLIALAVLGGTFVIAEEAADKFKDIKCPVSGGPAKEVAAKDYKGGKVYFCCDKCPEAFAKDVAKFAVKANHQLVATKQAEQKNCPLSGGPISDDQTVKVAEVKVGFCCEKCKGKVEGAKGDEQLTLVFSDDAFKKGFKVKEKKGEQEPKKDAAP
jgi:YHS domain-containing protein